MKYRSICLLTWLTVLSVPSAFAAGPKWIVDFDHAKGSLHFLAKGHPSALRINGNGDCPKGQLRWLDGKVSGALALDLASLDTGITMRTRHMKEKYLEVEKFPQAQLTLSHLAVPPESSSSEVPFQGLLRLHGVEKPVTGTAKLARNGNGVHLDAAFTINLTDYGIAIPSFAGITVSDDVALQVEADTPLQALP